MSLVEVVVSAALVAVMMVATLNGIGAVMETRVRTHDRQRAEAMAADLMAEIFQSPYVDPAGGSILGLDLGEGSATRADWDDIDDYDQLNESPPKTKEGVELPNSTGWRRQAWVERVEVNSPDTTTLLTDTGLERIRVRVRSPLGIEVNLRSWRSRWGTLEMRPPIDSTYVTGVRAELQVGEANTKISGGTAILNHAQ